MSIVAAGVLGRFWRESRVTMRLALPMIVGQIGQLVLPIVDSMMVGEIGVEALAGVSFGGAVSMFFLIMAMGLCIPVHVFVAQAFEDHHEGERISILVHGIWIVSLYSLPVGLMFMVFPELLGLFDQSEEVMVHGRPYLFYMMWSVWPALVFRCMRNFAEAQDNAWLPFYVISGAILMNIFLNWVFIFGNLGAPELGAAGAGLATFISRVLGVVVMAVVFWNSRRHRVRFGLKMFLSAHWSTFRRMLRLGVPTSLQIGFEFGAFSACTVMMGWLGAVELASQQVVINYTAIIFMIPLSISFATSIRVGEAVAKGGVRDLRAVGYSCIWLGGLFMLLFCGVTLLIRSHWAPFFVDDEAVWALVPQLLLWAAVFQVWDGVQVTAMAALRAMEDVWVPLLIVSVAYWGLSVGGGYYLAFEMGMGAVGIWIATAVALFIDAWLLVGRFEWLSRRYFSWRQEQFDQAHQGL